MDRVQFLEQLRQAFPDLAEELDEESGQGLLYVQLGALARYVRGAVDAGARAEVERCFAVIERANREGDDEVQNAIGVAFLRHLNFQDGKVRREWAFSVLPGQPPGGGGQSGHRRGLPSAVTGAPT